VNHVHTHSLKYQAAESLNGSLDRTVDKVEKGNRVNVYHVMSSISTQPHD
jgi:hypothetical protein